MVAISGIAGGPRRRSPRGGALSFSIIGETTRPAVESTADDLQSDRLPTHMAAMNGFNRRDLLIALGALMTAGPGLAAVPGMRLGRPERFSWDALKARAVALSRASYRPISPVAGASAVTYDALNHIQYRPDRTLWGDAQGGTGVRFFPIHRMAPMPVSIFVVENGRASALSYDAALFDMTPDHPVTVLDKEGGFAGFRVMNPGGIGDWLAFQGASYFRTAGAENQYGLSARGLAIDTGIDGAEEFPVFTHFWLERGPEDGVTVYALLDGPSVAGAYKFISRQTPKGIVQDVDAFIRLRRDVQRLGFAPMTSMFWYGEGNRAQAVDWRPEIHDSDGLSIVTGTGQRIWRPLINPPRTITNSFVDANPKGFGLLQRDRNFLHYQDDGVFYEKRPSLWAEPLEGWGAGSVMLYEIPTQSETDDNIVAFWTPAAPARGGATFELRYRLHWGEGEPEPSRGAIVTDTWTGVGGRPGHPPLPGVTKLVADFTGPGLVGLDRESGVKPMVELSRGELIASSAYPLANQSGRWRLMLDIAPASDEPADLRVWLARGTDVLSETLVYQLYR